MSKRGGGGGRSGGREQGVGNTATQEKSNLSATQDKNLIERKIQNEWKPELEKIENGKYSNVDKQKIKDYQFVIGEILSSEKNKYAITDDKGRMQALTSWQKKKDHVYVEYLATAPWNLKSGDDRNVKGAGTKAIVQAIKISEKLGFGGKLRLESSDTAMGFYKKLGFSTKGDGVFTLSSTKAKELLNKVQ